jgi:hypothetical protein
MRRDNLMGAKTILVLAAAIGLASCSSRHPGSFDADNSTSDKLGNLLAFNSLTAPPAPTTTTTVKVVCQEIIVLDGTAAQRVYNGAQSNDTLKYQYSLGDVARECAVQGSDVAMRIGVEGNVLLGPVGSPGNFNVPIRIAIVRESDQKPVVSKLYRVAATIPGGQTQGAFSFVSEPLLVPFLHEHSEDDYNIKIGIDSGSGAEVPEGKPRRARKHS